MDQSACCTYLFPAHILQSSSQSRLIIPGCHHSPAASHSQLLPARITFLIHSWADSFSASCKCLLKAHHFSSAGLKISLKCSWAPETIPLFACYWIHYFSVLYIYLSCSYLYLFSNIFMPHLGTRVCCAWSFWHITKQQGIVWEPVRKWAHTQAIREHSVTVVSARWASVDWSWPKEWN